MEIKTEIVEISEIFLQFLARVLCVMFKRNFMTHLGDRSGID